MMDHDSRVKMWTQNKVYKVSQRFQIRTLFMGPSWGPSEIETQSWPICRLYVCRPMCVKYFWRKVLKGLQCSIKDPWAYILNIRMESLEQNWIFINFIYTFISICIISNLLRVLNCMHIRKYLKSNLHIKINRIVWILKHFQTTFSR